MSDAPSSVPSISEFVLNESVRPASPQELQSRALFLTAGLGILCSKTLRAYMDHCDKKHLLDQSQKGVSKDLTMEQYSEAVKELLSVSIWLTLFEQIGHEIPEWFKEFILLCHGISDKVHTKPTAKEIQQKYSLNSQLHEICQQISVNLCMQLDLGNTVEDALLYLGYLLENERQTRLELLFFALTEPIQKLDERIKAG